MAFNLNHNDPMCRSIYMEQFLPTFNPSGTPATVPTMAAPEGFTAPPTMNGTETKDSFYYNNDGHNDGKISTIEKLKAVVKGGTYNMVRGLFCDNKGFSIGRTLATAACAGAIALTGPIGAAVAGGIGLLSAYDNYKNSKHRAKYAMTDQEARKAYEGFGESISTAGLSIWGGLKGLKAIKNNFGFAKANKNLPISLKQKLTKWNLKPKAQPVVQQPPQTQKPNGVAGTTGATVGVETGAEGYFNEWAPTGDMPKPTTHEYFNEWAPTGDMPKPTTHEYFNEWAPTGDIPKPTTPEIKPDGHFFG